MAGFNREEEKIIREGDGELSDKRRGKGKKHRIRNVYRLAFIRKMRSPGR